MYLFLLFVLKSFDISRDGLLGPFDLVLKLDCFVHSPELLFSQRRNLPGNGCLFKAAIESFLFFPISLISFPPMFYLCANREIFFLSFTKLNILKAFSPSPPVPKYEYILSHDSLQVPLSVTGGRFPLCLVW